MLNLLSTEPTLADYGFVYSVQSQQQAIAILQNRHTYLELAGWAWSKGLEAIAITHPGRKNPVKIFAKHYEEYLKMPQSLLIKDAELPYELQRYVFDMGSAESPQGLVRLRDNKQILLTENNRIVTPNCGTLLGATRDRYWNLDDLSRFEQEWRRTLEPGSDRWFEFTYTIHDLDQPGVNEQQKHNRYRLVVDAANNPYHICESLD